MTRGDIHHPLAAALVAIAALALVHGASAQGECSATQPCPDSSNCCSQYNYCGTTAEYCGAGCQSGNCDSGTPSAPGSGWSSFLTKDVFEGFFPNRNSFYTYEAFQTAGEAYPAFGTTNGPDDQRRELAAFLANVNQETGGLQYIEEIDKSGNYCTPSDEYPCAPNQLYYGRGALQLSYNYNYGECGQALGLDLLNNPGLVAQDPVVAFKTALWFWMSRSPNCHDTIIGPPPSFSGTIKIINGGVECNKPAGSLGNQEMQNRVTYYTNFCQTLNVDPGTDLTC